MIRPGGHLVLHDARRDLDRPLREAAVCAPDANPSRSPPRCTQRGSWYAPEFGAAGDWGVVNPAWGTAFLSAEWMLTNLLPHWRVLEFAPGRNQENQDVYVLRRV